MANDGHPSRLEAALRDYYSNPATKESPDRWKDYAFGAGERGRALMDTVTNVVPDLRGRRHLDIGCGYGGVCVAAAQAGAVTVGIDVDERLLELAELNRLDHPGLDLEFHRVDVLDWGRVVGLGTFDVVTADNVIEHVAVPEQLVSHVARLLRSRGVAYITVPNAFSIGQVQADCHYGLFGASLLDTWDAGTYLRHARGLPQYDVSAYYPFDVYAGFFANEGLTVELLMPGELTDESQRELADELTSLGDRAEGAIESGEVPLPLHDKLRWKVSGYVQRGQAALDALHNSPVDLRADLQRRIRRDYLEEAWYVMASKDPKALGYKRGTLRQRLRRRINRSFGNQPHGMR